MKTIKGFENEDIQVSDFGEWVGQNYVDYKFEYENNNKIIKSLYEERQQQKEIIQTYETLLKTNIEENKQLKDKINKVVEFINDINDWEICSKYDCIYKDDILEILKKLNINKGE